MFILFSFLQFNIRYQGKFVKVDKFELIHYYRRRFDAKLFLFEKSVVVTEVYNETELSFIESYDIDSVGIAFENGTNKMFLYNEKRSQREIECISSSATTAKLWTELLHNCIHKFKNRKLFTF